MDVNDIIISIWKYGVYNTFVGLMWYIYDVNDTKQELFKVIIVRF